MLDEIIIYNAYTSISLFCKKKLQSEKAGF